MQAFGVIAEYNPFHLGHTYQLTQARREGASHIVAVMSGSFVQRGEPSVFSASERARAALLCGADLVIELPLPWAMARAQTFARGGVSLIGALGVAKGLAFGSECGNAELLKKCALLLKSDEVSNGIKESLKQGMSFANAREAAVRRIDAECADALTQPNDILAVEYISAAQELNIPLTVAAIKREGCEHNAKLPEGGYASAGAIRKMLANGTDYSRYLPPEAAKVFAESKAADFSRLERAVLYKMRTVTAAEILPAPDVSEGIENRIAAAAKSSRSLEELYALAKTKRYSHARIRRIVMSVFLGVTAADSQGTPPYIRVLGFNSAGREILAEAKNKASLPIVMRRSDIDSLGERAKRIYALECAAADIRALCLPSAEPCGLLQSGEVIII